MLAGCHANPPECCVLLNSDFEQFDGWGTARPSDLNEAQAHSGRYSLQLPAGAEYGNAYRTRFDRCPRPLHYLYLSAWVYVPGQHTGSTQLVMEIDCHGRQPNVWQTFAIDEVVKRYHKWEPVYKRFRLPDGLAATDDLKLYVWHREAGDNIWLDDLRLEGE